MTASGPVLVRPENELERALVHGGRSDVLAALASADVYVRVAPSADGLALGTLERDGGTFVAAFTSLARLAAFEPRGGDYARLPGRALPAAAPGLAVVLNPGAELGEVLDADDLAVVERAPAPPEPWLLVGAPAEEPEALLAAIRDLGEREPAITAAYRALVLRRGAAAPELVLALELAQDADEETVVAAAADAARAAGIESLSLLVLADDELSHLVRERAEPFLAR